jgi:hyperosmotically inducible periplasmic protein
METRHTRSFAALGCALLLAACDTGDPAARKAASAARAAGANAAVERKDASAKTAVVTRQAVDATVQASGKVAEKLEDAVITAKVTTGLAADKNLSASRIKVATHDGAVTLKGPAPSAAARERATEIARNVKGVTSVDNQLAVQG